MRTLIVFLATIVVANSPVKAGVGFGILFSTGSEKVPVEGQLSLYCESNGKVLTPSNGIVEVPEGEVILGQVLINNAKEKGRYKVYWGTNTLITKSTTSEAEFTEDAGWMFKIQPDRLFGASEVGRPLHLVVTDKKGKHDFVRVFFKIGYDHDAISRASDLVLKTVQRQPEVVSAGVSGTTPAIDALRTNQQTTADYVSKLESRVTNLEGWASSVGTTTKTTTETNRMANFLVKFTGKTTPLVVKITAPNGQSKTYTISGSEAEFRYPAGDNYRISLSSNGREFGPEVTFYVRSGMAPVVVKIGEIKK